MDTFYIDAIPRSSLYPIVRSWESGNVNISYYTVPGISGTINHVGNSDHGEVPLVVDCTMTDACALLQWVVSQTTEIEGCGFTFDFTDEYGSNVGAVCFTNGKYWMLRLPKGKMVFASIAEEILEKCKNTSSTDLRLSQLVTERITELSKNQNSDHAISDLSDWLLGTTIDTFIQVTVANKGIKSLKKFKDIDLGRIIPNPEHLVMDVNELDQMPDQVSALLDFQVSSYDSVTAFFEEGSNESPRDYHRRIQFFIENIPDSVKTDIMFYESALVHSKIGLALIDTAADEVKSERSLIVKSAEADYRSGKSGILDKIEWWNLFGAFDFEFLKDVLLANPFEYKHLEHDQASNLELAVIAAREPEIYGYIPYPICEDKLVVEAALAANYLVYEHLPEDLREVKEYAVRYIKNDDSRPSYIPKILFSDQEFIKIFLEQGFAIDNLPRETPNLKELFIYYLRTRQSSVADSFNYRMSLIWLFNEDPDALDIDVEIPADFIKRCIEIEPEITFALELQDINLLTWNDLVNDYPEARGWIKTEVKLKLTLMLKQEFANSILFDEWAQQDMIAQFFIRLDGIDGKLRTAGVKTLDEVLVGWLEEQISDESLRSSDRQIEYLNNLFPQTDDGNTTD